MDNFPLTSDVQQFIKLSELTAKVHYAINDIFDTLDFWVLAEVTNYSFYQQKNHHYFDLVEKAATGNNILAKMQVAAWSTGNESIKRFERTTGQKFKNDIQVLVKVSVDFHPVYGLKLTLLDVDAAYTIGNLEKQKQETIQTLVNEGFAVMAGDQLITDNKRLPLPVVIQRIAVISSGQSAGLQDFVHTIENNNFKYKFYIDYFFTVVQGEANAELVYNKFIEIFSSPHHYDVVIVLRGGGSQTDFLLFDQLSLVKMVAKFPVPVITGIGHQKNETLVDLVANTTTKTPTKAAEFIIAHNRAFEDRVGIIEKSVIIKSQQLLATYKDALNQVRFKLVAAPGRLVSDKSNDLKNKKNEIKHFAGTFMNNKKIHLAHLASIIKTISPENILKKGYALIKMNNAIITDPDKIKTGDEISIIMHRQQLTSTVKAKKAYDGYESDI